MNMLTKDHRCMGDFEQPVILGPKVQTKVKKIKKYGNIFGHALTNREWEVVNEIGHGNQNKIIAYHLGISEQTVKNHITSVMAKTGVKSRLMIAIQIYPNMKKEMLFVDRTIHEKLNLITNSRGLQIKINTASICDKINALREKGFEPKNIEIETPTFFLYGIQVEFKLPPIPISFEPKDLICVDQGNNENEN